MLDGTVSTPYRIRLIDQSYYIFTAFPVLYELLMLVYNAK